MKIEFNNKELDLTTPHVMGILNTTPDSFSDGGQYSSVDHAVQKALKMIESGATIIDIGGESTRPGAPAVSLEEELSRVIPVIKALRRISNVWISIDTSKADVMDQAILAGADIVNDVRALTSKGALDIVAKHQVPVCIMHMQGQPSTMQTNPSYDDLVQDVASFLQERVDAATSAGIKKDNIILDPGFGFGKTLEHNYQLLSVIHQFHQFELPLLIGVSRKSMIFKLLDKKPDETALGSALCAAFAVGQGAQIIRVHDVEETVDAIKITQFYQKNSLVKGQINDKTKTLFWNRWHSWQSR
ncbi:dihydropteroate synthase [Vibrio sp.]|nr:dihydropteroate synthase [Vibrio sp.]